MAKKRPHAPRLLSLCSGIGGIDLAWEMAGGEIAGQCELDDYCQRVLARHWPEVKRVSDIRSVWGDSFDGPIDLVAGGIPCQPWSIAGKRRGHADDRHLWPEMRRIVAIYQPAWVLIENVAGFARLALDGVLADLGADGYEASAVMVPAAALGAPHLRERIFVVAHRDDDGGRWAQRAERGDVAGETRADATREGRPQRLAAECGGEDVANTCRERWAQDDAAQRGAARQSDCRAAGRTTLVNTSGAGRQECDPSRVACDAGHAARRSTQRSGPDGRDGKPESRMGRDSNGLPRRLDGAGRADTADALIPPRHAWPAFRGEAQHAWEPPRVTQERIPNRAARLKALGNAVVPNQVYPILAAIIAVWRQEQEVSA